MQRWKTVDSIARGAKEGAAFHWYGRRFRVHHGPEATAVPVKTFVVGGTPRVVWSAESSTALEKLIDRLADDDETSEATRPKGWTL